MTHPNLIAGKWRDSAASRADVNPSNTADIVGRYAAADADQAREAVAAAAEAAAGWAATPRFAAARSWTWPARNCWRAARSWATCWRAKKARRFPRPSPRSVRAGQVLKFHAGQAVRNTGEMLDSMRPGSR